MSKKKQPDTFKAWVKSHDPKFPWNWNDPEELHTQLVEVISESGNIDLKTIFTLLFAFYDAGLNEKQTQKFLDYANPTNNT